MRGGIGVSAGKCCGGEYVKRDYVAFIDSLLREGYAKKFVREEVRTDDACYLPHHDVYHPSKKKIRVVFDCSARFKGISLNDRLLQGPDLLNPLVGVLCKFRQEPVAFIGDVEAMFHQVRVVPDHHNFLRFLWWPDGDLSQPLHEYVMTVHLFGATSSPSIANLALHKTADLSESLFGINVANVIRRNFYVDDYLVSVSSEEEAIALVRDLKGACHLGEFKHRGNIMREDTWPKAYGGDVFRLASVFCDLGMVSSSASPRLTWVFPILDRKTTVNMAISFYSEEREL